MEAGSSPHHGQRDRAVPIQTGLITAELEARVVPAIPPGHVGKSQDIADAVVFLASAQARWIADQVIQVAGGHAL